MYTGTKCAEFSVTKNAYRCLISLPPPSHLTSHPGAGSPARGQLCPEGGPAGGAAARQALHLCHRERRHREDQDPALTEQDLPDHEEEARLAGPQPQGRHQRRALRLHQPLHKRVEGR